MRGGQRKQDDGEQKEAAPFKFMKSKENVQALTLTIIALTVHLSTQNSSKGYFLERILKKSIGDLRSCFKEIGLLEEATKRRDRESGEQVDDVLVYFSGSKAAVKQAQEAENAQVEEGEAAEQ